VDGLDAPNVACSYNGIDLSSLVKTAGDYEGSDATYAYKMNVCGTSNAGTGCTDKGRSVCQYLGANVVAGLGTFADGNPVWSYIDATTPSKGVSYQFTNGDKCWTPSGDIPRPVIVQFPCSKATSQTFTITENKETCTFTIVLPTDKSCPGGAGPSGGSTGLSGGSVFLIILVVVVPLYIAGGCLYKNRKLGTTGKESCPNIDVWSQIPGLVMDGCRFTWMMIRTGCKGGKSGASYNQI